jgi:hypothetical protein
MLPLGANNTVVIGGSRGACSKARSKPLEGQMTR